MTAKSLRINTSLTMQYEVLLRIDHLYDNIIDESNGHVIDDLADLKVTVKLLPWLTNSGCKVLK